MVGIYAAVSTANHMARVGRAPRRCSAPIRSRSAFRPARKRRWCSTSPRRCRRYGTIRQHVVSGKPMPDGWVVHSKTGKPINDPKKVGEGVLLPIGDYKGSGLALIIGLLAGVLNGAAFGRDVIDFTATGIGEDQHRAVRGRDRRVALHPAGGVRGRDGPPSQRSALVGAACRASTRSGCRARTAASAAPIAPRTAWRCRRRW